MRRVVFNTAEGRFKPRYIRQNPLVSGQVLDRDNPYRWLSVTGPAEIVGENPFSIVGGVGAVWLKAREAGGAVRLTAKHQYLGTRTADVRVKPVAAEAI